jgi:hypothetical protein
MTMKFSSAVLLLVCALASTPLATAAFQPPRRRSSSVLVVPSSTTSPTTLHASSTDLANRLVRANEEKAAAIRAAERRNQAEIEALKSQIDQIEAVFAGGSSSYYSPSPPSLPANLSGLSKFELQNKLREFQDYLSTVLARSESNQREAASILGGGGGGNDALKIAGTAAIAGTFGGLVSGALDSNRRDSIGGIVAGVAGSAAGLLNKPANEQSSNEPKGLPLPPGAVTRVAEDPQAPVRIFPFHLSFFSHSTTCWSMYKWSNTCFSPTKYRMSKSLYNRPFRAH